MLSLHKRRGLTSQALCLILCRNFRELHLSLGRSGGLMEAPVLEFCEVTKRFGDVTAVDRVSFKVSRGELYSLLGPSGCGKSTTLRLIAGLEEPDEGEILLNGKPIASPGKGIFLPPEKRQMGMVFQSYAIWPHLTVFENVAFPLRVRREPSHLIKERVLDALSHVGLSGLEDRGATDLSGGQQQRVALARALVYTPAILLLDEPLSNLDAKLREQMRFELRSLQRRLKLSVLYVTHDQTEAMTLSDRIAVMHQGKLAQEGSPMEVYEKPATAFVGDFLGRTVTIDGTLVRDPEGTWVALSFGSGRLFLGDDRKSDLPEGKEVRVFSRPEDVEILSGGEILRNQVGARVEEVAYLGDHYEYSVRAGEQSFVLPAGKREQFPVGSEVRLVMDPKRLTVMPL
jgi:ABC-type Fe3+/spermidine/putrescine transport system ATPase subunit